MTASIRLRIALFVLAAVALSQLALSLLVLDRLHSADRSEIDALITEKIHQVSRLLGRPDLGDVIEAGDREGSKWSETFYEIRDPAGGLRLASSNLPAGGLGPAVPPFKIQGGVVFWERVHPASRKGHRRIRVGQTEIDGYRVRVARGLRSAEKTYLAVRARLVWGLLGVTALAWLGAWWIAHRSLRPLRAMIERAGELGVSAQGELPRSGRGDELDRLAAVLNDLLGRLRAELARMRRMTADAAHALRTPLTAIRGNLEVMRQRAAPDVAAELDPAVEAIDELAQLTHRLLLLERLESTSAPGGRTEVVDLDQLALRIADAYEVVAGDRGIALTCNAEPATVRGDVAELRSALANLVDNALRHTPAGGRVELRVETVPGRARIRVEDSGPGLRPDQLERVFERFYSEPGTGGGAGLGLAIARAIARAHGGDITASSPKGARFDLELPLAPPAT